MAREALIQRYGGPDVIEWREVALPAPGSGQVRVRHRAVGVNFIDIYHRNGTYPAELPSGLGLEAAGIVEAVGAGVNDIAPGDRVATFGPSRGAYATERNVAADMLVRLPDDIDDETAAAALLKGCTVEFLVERAAKVQPGWTVLVHASAGGVGLILTQWLKAVGAMVIGTVGDHAKARAAHDAGADSVILYREENTAERVRALTGGAGVQVVFDGVGRATWPASLDSCARRGLVVSYGNADAPVTGVDLAVLASKGSLHVTRPTLFDYYAAAAERRLGVERLFALVRSGKVKVTIGQRYPLEEVARAHADLASRRTSGSTILLP